MSGFRQQVLDMARPREFDEDTVLEAAMRCFWAQGYDATSVRDLAAEMGITGASLYNAFGDKRSLYRRAWDRYLTHSVHDRMARLSDVPPLAAIAGFFDEIVERSVADDQPAWLSSGQLGHGGCSEGRRVRRDGFA